MFDDYLPQWKDAWQRHLERVQFAQSRICTDSLEVQRRVATAYEKLIPALVQQGKLVGTDAGAAYRLSAIAALRMAVGLWSDSCARRGHSAARNPRQRPQRHLRQVPRPVRARQWMLWRPICRPTQPNAPCCKAPAQPRSKWLVFGITALLFLLVGLVDVVVLRSRGAGRSGAARWALPGHEADRLPQRVGFFLPGLGGLAVGEKPTPTEKVLVYLTAPCLAWLLAELFWASRTTGVAGAGLAQRVSAGLLCHQLPQPAAAGAAGRRARDGVAALRPPSPAALCLCGAVLRAAAGRGFWMNDLVLRAVAVLIALGLPAQWRRARFGPLVARDHTTALDEPTALRRIFTALQDARFGHGRSPSAAPQPRRCCPRSWAPGTPHRSGVGLLVYAVCLLAPWGAALWTVPHLGDAMAIMAQTPRLPRMMWCPTRPPTLPARPPTGQPDWPRPPA